TAMERDYDYDSVRFLDKMKDPALIGRSAGRRVVARLGARKLQSQTAPVVFHNRIAPSLLNFLISAITGAAVARGVSFLRDRLGKPVFAAGVSVVDDPTVSGGWASRTFDGEGSPVKRRAIIEDGVLTTWLLNHASAQQLGMTTTGHAAADPGRAPGTRPSNLTLVPGSRDMAGLMADAGTGLLVMETFSPSFNPNTGDYSVGISGHWFENGVIAHPVHETTIAGSMPEILARLIPGSDLYGKGAVDAPSVLVDAMTLAGV
ncbi:MAG: metallopeptidase TldD-related protein, partial [Hyphomonadaceae bacterium]|nr:metallopeptidase TldD-related protein [Hyphomonadaceae bacterium]